jgi:integrase
MPTLKRIKTQFPGVYYVKGTSQATGKPERIYYIRYRREGKLIEEKAGRQFQNNMTPEKAAQVRTRRIHGDEPSNEETRTEVDGQKKVEAKKWPLNKLWEEYKAQRPDLKGLYTDENRYKLHLEPIFGEKEPREITQFEVDRLRLRLLKKRKPQTVKHILALLKRIVNFGKNKCFCEGLGFKVEMPVVRNERTEDLSPEQLSALLKAIDSDSNTQAAAMMKLALFTGMRRGAILRLEWRDVDFERGIISLRDAKGGSDEKIPLNEASREIFTAIKKTTSRYVFPGRRGNQKPAMNGRFINRMKEEAGLPKGFRPMHGLRHTYASMLASSGQVDMYSLQKLLTHKDPRMTQRYSHQHDEALKRASGVADEILDVILNGKKDIKVANLEDN